MARVFRKRVRQRKGGVNLVADVDAAVAVNRGASKRQRVNVRSRHTVVQRSPRTRSDPPAGNQSETKENP
jgi:hypothetical protein